MAAVPTIRFDKPGVKHESHRPAAAFEILRDTVVTCTPASEQPLGRRIAFVMLVTLALSLILPAPVVVSEVSRSSAGFQPFPERTSQSPRQTFANVWVVESTDEYDLYSNGLRVENAHAIQNNRRFYQILDRSNNMQASAEWRSEPAGIVYHTTESPQAPFDAGQNEVLRRFGQGLVGHIQRNRSYNFVIDRFGRVHRVVEESDVANHSGNSVWADGNSVFVNLNASFLAIAFETATDPSTGLPQVNNAQVYAGRNLTQMLRAKYRINAQNCVTHAQVSVNPSNMKIGYHTDWAARFPFGELGLPHNYDLPLVSLTDFGFEYDDTFKRSMGEETWRGLALSERQLQMDAAESGMPLAEYRAQMKDRYRKLYSGLKLTGAVGEVSLEP